MPSSTTFGFSEHLPGLLMAAGVSLLSFLLLMNLRFKLSRRAASRHISPAFAAGLPAGPSARFDADPEVHPPARRGAAESRAARPAAVDDSQIVAAHESVRLLIRELDTRCRTLEILLRQADERIRQLEDSLDERVGASISPTRTALSERPRKAAGAEPVRSGERAALAEEAPAVEVLASADRFASLPPDPLSASVYELADRGRSAVEIARSLDEQIGKVELILALRGER